MSNSNSVEVYKYFKGSHIFFILCRKITRVKQLHDSLRITHTTILSWGSKTVGKFELELYVYHAKMYFNMGMGIMHYVWNMNTAIHKTSNIEINDLQYEENKYLPYISRNAC